MRTTIAALLAGAVLLAACARNERPATAGSTSGDSTPAGERAEPGKDPFPSTYRAYPGTPTAIRGATVFDGEGKRWDGGTVVFAEGRIVAVGGPDVAVPAGATVIDGTGKTVTPGIIDIHSHLGNFGTPGVPAHSDGNEATNPVTAQVWAEHSVWPQDPGFSRALANGGVTTLMILPGSANLFGGRSVTVKNVPARTVQAMKFPGAPYGLKMACGENPKRVYGGRNQLPGTRMGNVALDRQTWIRAEKYRRDWQRWLGGEGSRPDRDLGLETLSGVLAGEILVQNHCYRADEMAIVIDMAKEFGYKVTAFHHAVESYKIADLLAREGVCSAMWSDWYGFKMESYDAVPENVPLVHNAGACAIVHSDDPNGIQRLNQETAKALADGRRMGINVPDEVAWRWLTINPATAMGIADRTGSLRDGKMADVVMWNGDPFSVYARPEKVWIDGAMMYDALDPRRRPVSDFELGQPGQGDTK